MMLQNQNSADVDVEGIESVGKFTYPGRHLTAQDTLTVEPLGAFRAQGQPLLGCHLIRMKNVRVSVIGSIHEGAIYRGLLYGSEI